VLTSIWAVLILAVAGAAVGVPLARLSARRSVHQPVSLEPQAEIDVLAAVAVDITMYLRVIELRATDFADAGRARVWARIADHLACIPNPEGIDSETAADAWIARQLTDHAELFSTNPVHVFAEEEGVVLGSAPEGELKDRIVSDAEAVVAAAEDRNVFNGRSLIVPGPEDGPSLIRTYVAPTRGRVVGAVVIHTLAWAAAPLMTERFAQGTLAILFGIAALLVLSTASLLWALVDLDTMYLDTPTFWPGAILAWGLAIGAAVADYDPGRLLPGIIIAVGGAIVFELANLGYRIVRGTDGMGGGDTLILLATAGVPAALFGSWTVGYYAALGSMILGVIGWVSLFIAGKVQRHSPFAFGPYLALGWLLTCTLMTLVN
jgi:prepilin signal peptidase PulO-like enzyme (type II secretory pathway)